MAGGGETVHVGADLGNDDLGGEVADPRDRGQELDGSTKGREASFDLLVEGGDRGIQVFTHQPLQRAVDRRGGWGRPAYSTAAAGRGMVAAGGAMLKALIKPLCPPPMLAAWRRARLAHMRRRNAARSIGGVFEDVYRRNAWGGAPGEWRSGSGSDAEQLGEYATAVADFIREHGIRSVVDLGCGDFRVGAEIASRGVDYTGVDIVPGLIERNARAFGSERIRFVCLDITRDDPPPGELCLVRQVFQHLSNAEITAALPRLSRYRYVLVTEHQPAPGRMRRPNIDKPHGPDTRIIDGSAVCLDAPPFGLPGVTGFHEAPAVIPLVAPGETLRTVLLTGTG